MLSQFDRTERLIGAEALAKLARSHVAVFGLGGVGGFAVEALARAGIGQLTLVDFDAVDVTNLNRQIFALHSTLKRPKTEVAKARVWDINPEAQVNALNIRFDSQTAAEIDFSAFDYVVDAVDMVTAKLLLAQICAEKHIQIISSMGTGNKLDPTAFKVADVFETKMCPLAKVMRRELKKRGISRLKVVYSEEQPLEPKQKANPCDGVMCAEGVGERQRQVPASISFVPPVAGMILASEVVKDLIFGHQIGNE